jgi:acyl carrier protein
MTIQNPALAAGHAALSEEERIAFWLRQYISRVLALPEKEINPNTSFNNLGLDSSSAVAMTGDLADWRGCIVDASAAYDHPSIAKLSKAVAALPQQTRRAA